jgi:hypothetical protein
VADNVVKVLVRGIGVQTRHNGRIGVALHVTDKLNLKCRHRPPPLLRRIDVLSCRKSRVLSAVHESVFHDAIADTEPDDWARCVILRPGPTAATGASLGIEA